METRLKILRAGSRIANEAESASGSHLRVWDVPTRLFHWAIVMLVATSWFTAQNGFMRVHMWSGLLLLTLLIFRVAWGLLGSTTARFSDFVSGPGKVLGYVRDLARGSKRLYGGHNPAGGWMVVMLIGALALQAVTGLFANDGVHFDGPLAALVSAEASDRVTNWHGMIFNFILLLVWMHVVAVFFYLCVHRENLVGPMVTGRKKVTHVPAGLELRFASVWFAALIVTLAAGIVWWIAGT
jgi:cytochrome b